MALSSDEHPNMSKVTPISRRKKDHIRINLQEDVRSALTTGLDQIQLEHNAAPELDLNKIDLSSSFLDHTLDAPILISSMTGGTPEAEKINIALAEAAQARGIAMGLGRPFVLVKDKGADVSPLAQGLEYYPINSYLELRYELGEKVRPFLADIVNYRLQALPPAGSQGTAVIAHGDLDVIDLCVPVAKMIAEYGLTLVVSGDPTGKLAHYLELEGIPSYIIGSTGRTRLT